MVIHPEGGLCNMLRVVFSYLKEARKQKRRLIVIWKQTDECQGWFLDYYQPIPHVTFVKDSDLDITYRGGNIHPNYDEHSECIYNHLQLVPWLQSELDEKRKQLGDYIAVHIRRTDHVALAKAANKYTSDEDFMKFIEANNKNIYLATDNKDTYTTYKRKYEHRIPFEYHNDTNTSLRATSLKDSILDLYMCVYASEFQGSGYSSFSDLIYVLRRCTKDFIHF
jgi:hypothetical protein